MAFPKPWIVLLILSFEWVQAEGPFYVFRDITTADGLASNSVTSVLQDEKGFIWIATDNGLQRYDGYSFVNYHHRPFDDKSLSSDLTAGLLEDKDHNIWTLGVFWGFNIMHPGTGSVEKIGDPTQRVFRNLNSSSGFCQDGDGNIWLLAMNSLAMYDIRRHRLISYNQALPPAENMSFTRSILWDSRLRCLWINSARYGVCLFDPAKKIFYYRNYNPRHWPVLDFQDGAGLMLLDRSNHLWVSTYSGRLVCYDPGVQKWSEYYFDGGSLVRNRPHRSGNIFVACMLQDREGTIWAGLRGSRLMRLDPGATAFTTVQPYPINEERMNEYTINDLLEDRDGNIWVGSSRGIHIFSPRRQRFISVPLPAADSKSSSDYSVANFLETRRGEIWLATLGGGIYVYDRQLQLKRVYYNKSPGGRTTKAPGEPENRVWCLLERPDGKIWAGCQHGWLAVYDPASDRWSNSQPPALDRLTIINMVQDGPNMIWMTQYDGFAKWDAGKGGFVHYNEFMPFRGTREAESIGVVPDKRRTVWISTLDHGLQEFDIDSDRCIRMYAPRAGDSGSISSVSIQSVIPIGDSLLGMGTGDGGIDIFNRRTGKVSVITTEDGLPSNSVSAVWYRSPGQVWATTAAGLCRVDMRTRRVTRYGAQDGVVSNEFGDLLGFYQLRDGRLLAGYRGGFVCFHPDSLEDVRKPADVRITSVGIFEQPLRLDSALRGSDTLIFSYRENFITLQYASLSYLGASDIRYSYQLEGIEKDWVEAADRRYASFTNLPTGRYVFRVRARDKEGNYSMGTTMLVIVIRPPFWETWWFYLLMVLVTAGIVFVVYRYRLHQELRVAAIRNKISRDLHDDLGATLSSITVLSEIARTRIEEGSPEQSFPLLGKIRSYSGEMVGKMRDIVWAIDPRNDTLSTMIQRLKQYSAEWCANREMRLHFTATNEFLQMTPPMNTRKNFYLICKEAIYNSIRHSGAANITVDCRLTGGMGEVVITDDGKGFDPDMKYEGNGLGNMRARAGEIGARFSILSEKGRTAVIIRLAVPKIRD